MADLAIIDLLKGFVKKTGYTAKKKIVMECRKKLGKLRKSQPDICYVRMTDNKE